MKIAVLSGKGGTGKTLVSVNLAAAAKASTYIDCDVEEPNGHLFFKPEKLVNETVAVKIPEVDNLLCNGCRKCIEFCKFNALAYIGDTLLVFEEVCHSCGGCALICPEKALREKEKAIGEIQRGVSGNVKVITGILNTGEASGIPIIKKLLDDMHEGNSKEDKKKNNESGKEFVFIDCPPGSACIVMESIKDVDYCILVAEPTLFGVHNLSMVHELVKLFGKPCGAVLNKCLDGENPAEKYCRENGINILCQIPYENEIGTMNSNALILARENDRYQALFRGLLDAVAKGGAP
ncbi:MAG: ATPase [Firmicutes bacterium]|nr:ATPase [Bacillota bacterium]